jgi:hypothetical protein
MRLSILSFAAISSIVLHGAAFAQQRGCKFLNEDCDRNPKPSAVPEKPNRSDSEHLARCLADYVQRNGPFVPEGQSTKQVKSRSDMTSMCKFAIERKNYYWDLPVNLDATANLNCCIKSQGSVKNPEKVCRDGFARGSTYDWCASLHESTNRVATKPPKEWNVPPGCTGGPCSITPGYCKAVGYTPDFERVYRANIAEALAPLTDAAKKAAQEMSNAILRVCFGAR